MEKSKDKTVIFGNDLEVQYANLVSKSKLMESDLKKEIVELKILYQSEKEKSSSLENSIKNYPLKVSALEKRLSEETALRKSLESALEESSNYVQKEPKDKELDRYKQACTQLQSENRSLYKQHADIVKDKDELQEKLTEYIDFLNKKNLKMKEDHEKLIEEIKFEEEQRRNLDNSENQKKIEDLNAQITYRNQQLARVSHKNEDFKASQLKLAAEIDEKESVIRCLQKQNEELLGRTYTTDIEISNKIEDLSSNIDKLKTENLHLKNKIVSKKDKFHRKKESYLKEINDMSYGIRDLEKNKTKVDLETTALRSKIHEQSEIILNLHNKIKDCEEEQNEIVKQTKQAIEPVMLKLRTERDAFKAQLEETCKSIDYTPAPSSEPSLFDELNNLTTQHDDNLELEMSKVSQEKAELQKEIASLRTELSEKTIALADIEFEIESLRKQQGAIQELQNEIEENQTKISNLERNKRELQENIDSLLLKISENKENLKTLDEEKAILQEEIKRLKNIESEIKQKENTISDIENQKAELQKEIELLKNVNSKLMKKELTLDEIPDVEDFSPNNSQGSDTLTDQLNSELLEKDSFISELYTENEGLQEEIRELRRKNKNIFRHSKLNALSPKYSGRDGIAAILELESERDMLKSEIMRLETQLQISNHEWTIYSNQLRDELEKEQHERIMLIQFDSHRKTLNQSMSQKKISWWKRKFGNRSGR